MSSLTIEELIQELQELRNKYGPHIEVVKMVRSPFGEDVKLIIERAKAVKSTNGREYIGV